MAWAIPKYNMEQVGEAGAKLIDPSTPPEELDQAFAIINNWRSSHNFPLNTFQIGLRRKARKIYQASLVAQRIKRLSSIAAKLRRFDWLTLQEMQDIGGCRAVVGSVRSVRKLVRLYINGSIKHKLVDQDDYIENPKRSGYRGIHLIYRYYSDRNPTYNNLKIEMQLRSPVQHIWATAVETAGTFTHQALKSSQGQEDWLRFFALMGSWFAAKERTNPIPETPKNKTELKQELRHYAKQIDVVNHLELFGTALEAPVLTGLTGAHYFLLQLDSNEKRIRVTGYKLKDLEEASNDYLAVERDIAERPGNDAVLVSVESLSALRRAYPNYFLDLKTFIRAVKEAI